MRIGVVGNPRYEGLRGILGRLTASASAAGWQVIGEPALEPYLAEPGEALNLVDAGQPIDALVTVGGDGTLLRAARTVAPVRDVPLLGINVGRVGYLTTTTADHLEDALAALFSGSYRLEERKALRASIDGEGGDGGFALNDIVVHIKGLARVLSLRVMIDGEEIGQYSADGIIVATPTGSTAYSLSAGGPIVVPGVDAIIVTAICPHTLAVRPIVVRAGAEISIVQAPPFEEEALVSYDGQVGAVLAPGKRITMRTADACVKLVRVGKEGFFTRVREKLKWGDLDDRERT